MLRLKTICLGLFFLFTSGSLHAETGVNSKYINTQQFASIYDHAIVVDCRSRLEYDILHIKDAVHIPSGTMVREDLDLLRQQFPHRPLIFYCNGGG